jgi:hypothetical protein
VNDGGGGGWMYIVSLPANTSWIGFSSAVELLLLVAADIRARLEIGKRKERVEVS